MKKQCLVFNSLLYNKAISLKDTNTLVLPNNGLLSFSLETKNIHYGKAKVEIKDGDYKKESFTEILDIMDFDEYCITTKEISKEKYLEEFSKKQRYFCRLLGYSYEIQDSVILDSLIYNLKLDVNTALNLVDSYCLLAQFESSVFNFNNDGLISFIIKKEDLLNLDFSNVFYEVQE